MEVGKLKNRYTVSKGKKRLPKRTKKALGKSGSEKAGFGEKWGKD